MKPLTKTQLDYLQSTLVSISGAKILAATKPFDDQIKQLKDIQSSKQSYLDRFKKDFGIPLDAYTNLSFNVVDAIKQRYSTAEDLAIAAKIKELSDESKRITAEINLKFTTEMNKIMREAHFGDGAAALEAIAAFEKL